ncbi:hypothetical protein AB0H51_28125 [Streptomyces griseoluteus]|uniref:hypothetical protein n=1 Tax=Streptomyces griseoluteus TaxID=29306 RepID=UPI0033EAB807
MSLSRMLASMNACRLHGEGCHVTWGYDQAHTDSRRPYTLQELAEREAPPHRYAYPTNEAYVQGFRLWRALRRDARPTHLESLTATAVRLAPLMGRALHTPPTHGTPGCETARALEDLTDAPDGFHAAAAFLCSCERLALSLPIDWATADSVPESWRPKAPRTDPVTAQSANVHGDPPAPCWPVRGPGRNDADRVVSNRIDTDLHAPAPGGYPGI